MIITYLKLASTAGQNMLDLGKECIVQCSLPNVRARAAKSEGGASRVRARLHDVVSNSSARFVIFLLASPLSSFRTKCSPSSDGITRVSHYPNVRSGERGCTKTTKRPTAVARRTSLRPSVRFRVVWLRFRHHFVFRLPCSCARQFVRSPLSACAP